MTEAVEDPGPSFLDSLGDRGRRRAEPRTSVSLAGAGCVLGVVGVLVLAGDTGFDDEGELNRLPGVVLCTVLIALGYFVLARVRSGALATAGTVAAALGVPALLFFLTYDDGGFPPYNTEVILIVSTATWLATFGVGPGKGRPFFLGAGLIGLWFTVLELIENVFEFPFDGLGWFFVGASEQMTFDETGTEIDPDTGELIFPEDVGGDFGFEEPSFDAPDPATIGLLSLGFGVAFLLLGRWLDKRGHHGAATPLSFAAIPCLAVGVIGLAPDLEAAGSGLLLVAIGLGLAYAGATVWRRGTSWIGGATAALGLAIFLGDMAGDDATTGGMLFLAGGLGLVFVGHLIGQATGEPDELVLTATMPVVAAEPTRLVPVAEPDTDPKGDPDEPWKPPPPPLTTTDDPGPPPE